MRDELIAREKLRIRSTFVPLSLSRNALKPNSSVKLSDLSYNWKTNIIKDDHTVLTDVDYMQGIGHSPTYKKHGARFCWEVDLLWSECEFGKLPWKWSPTPPGFGYRGNKKIPEPRIKDVLYSLISDTDVLNYNCFEDWAPDLGYNPDSRKAEKIYQTCLQHSLALRNGLGESVLTEFQEAFHDY